MGSGDGRPEVRRLLKEPQGTQGLGRQTSEQGSCAETEEWEGVEAMGPGGERRQREKWGIEGSQGLHSLRGENTNQRGGQRRHSLSAGGRLPDGSQGL